MARLNITVPDDLYRRAERWRDRINISKVCRDAIARELDKLEQLPEEVRSMHEALTRLGREKAKVERSCFRQGVFDGLEWARGSEYGMLRRWGERGSNNGAVEEALDGPAADSASKYEGDPSWDARPYAEGWLAGVQQFWQRAKKSL